MTSGSRQLADWIARRGITQREAAKLLGFTEQFVGALVLGRKRPGLSRAVTLEDVAGISVRSWQVSQLSKSETRVLIMRVK